MDLYGAASIEVGLQSTLGVKPAEGESKHHSWGSAEDRFISCVCHRYELRPNAV
jgi:hypothetical protein